MCQSHGRGNAYRNFRPNFNQICSRCESFGAERQPVDAKCQVLNDVVYLRSQHEGATELIGFAHQLSVSSQRCTLRVTDFDMKFATRPLCVSAEDTRE